MGSNNITTTPLNVGVNFSTSSNNTIETSDTSGTRERADNLRNSVVNSRYSASSNYGSNHVYSRVDEVIGASNTNEGAASSTRSTTSTGTATNTSTEAVALTKKNKALEMLGDLILESAVSTNTSNIAVDKDQQLSGVVKALSEIFGDQESRTGYTGISGQVLDKFKNHQKFNNGAPIALSTETLAEIYKFVAVAKNADIAPLPKPVVLKGIDSETKQEIKDVDDLIQNQILKYESMLKTNKNFAISDKLGFWTREKKMQELLKARLDQHGVDEDLKENFKKLYSSKVDILENKAKQGPFDKINYKAEGNLILINSTLTQMATGITRTDLQENRSVTTAISDKVTEKQERFIESRESFIELNKKLQDKTLSKTDIKKINAELKKARKELDIRRSEYYKMNSLSIRFGLRSAFNFNDTDRAQYSGAIRDIEALDGKVDLNLLP